jgi:ArsR family transcriptional regulator
MYAIIISMMNEMTLRALKALADPTRLQIVAFLSTMCCGRAAVNEDGGVEGPTAGEICCHITGAQRITSTVSHHLHELEAAGLVQIERRGKTMVCTLRPEGLETLSDFIRSLANADGRAGCTPVGVVETRTEGCCGPN